MAYSTPPFTYKETIDWGMTAPGLEDQGELTFRFDKDSREDGMSMVMWVDTPWGNDRTINQCDKAIDTPYPSKWNVYSWVSFPGPDKSPKTDCFECCRLEDTL